MASIQFKASKSGKKVKPKPKRRSVAEIANRKGLKL